MISKHALPLLALLLSACAAQPQAAADPGARGSAPVPGLPAAARGAAQAAGQDRLPQSDALTATEQAIQLDELIKWVRAQAAVDNNTAAGASLSRRLSAGACRMKPDRLNALTDGVVAIVLTIMVLELKFPAEPTLAAALAVLPLLARLPARLRQRRHLLEQPSPHDAVGAAR